MAQHNKLGNKGEDVAAQFLADKGYKLKARNWRFGKLEVDIIADYNDMIIFIEVKSRSGTYFEQPFQAVTKKKQRFMVIWNHYLEKQSLRRKKLRNETVIIEMLSTGT